MSHTPKYYAKACRTRRRTASLETAEANATHRVYRMKKDGTPGKAPHIDHTGRSAWTEDEAEAEAARMMSLNPGTAYTTREM